MKILFMGTPEFAKVILESLIEDFDVVGLFCQPDKPFGRKQELKMPETKEYIKKFHPDIPVFQPNDFDEEVLKNIDALKPDFIVVVAYGKILPQRVLEYKCINIHASLLPKYRGASPIQEMILHNDSLFGVSAMMMEEGLDSGDVLGFSVLKNDFQVEVDKLSERLAILGAKLIKDVLSRYKMLIPLKQDNIKMSYCKKIKKQAGEVEFVDAYEVFTKARAYKNWPGIFLKNGLKIFDIALVSLEGGYEEGEILKISQDGVEVGCKKGVIKISNLQAPNKQKVSALNYVNGKRLQIGMILE